MPPLSKLAAGTLVLFAYVSPSLAADSPKEDLILCDCGIGDNKGHPTWSTSRQMNWYEKLTWPDSANTYPDAPDQAVEVPYNSGKYPWIYSGVTATLKNGDVWTAYIEDGTPDGFKAGTAVSSKNGKTMLNCWAYRGRPISAAINTTITKDAACWTAFVCNHDNSPPPRPDDMKPKTSSLTTQTSAPTTSVFSETAAATGGNTPKPTGPPGAGDLLVNATVNPRYVNWQNTWDSFLANFGWDPTTGRCIGTPIVANGYTIAIDCGGLQIDADSHMTLLMIEALRDVGRRSLLFNQSPMVPGSSNGTNNTSTSWVVMPEAFSLAATDGADGHVVGYLSYRTKYDGFVTGPCQACDTSRFNSDFFDPIIAAMQGSYPVYHSFTIQAQCDPWLVCK